MKRLLLAAAIALIPCQVFGQTPGRAAADAGLAMPTGHEVGVGLGGYTYIEPGDLRISIHGAKFGGEYTGTFSLNQRQRWFARANARATIGSTTYDGWCAPWLITPNSASPNGYQLDLGDFSPCSETGDKDWYLEGRALEPYYVRWNIDASSVNFETATFTVNGITAKEQLGFYEPWNVTNEFGVKVGFHFF